MKDVILSIADDLYNDCKMEEDSDYYDPIWDEKYIRNTFKPDPSAKDDRPVKLCDHSCRCIFYIQQVD